jgi:toxin FitB
MNWLLDTNIISETRKPKADLAAMNWLGQLPALQLHTTEVNMAELVYGAESQEDVLKRRELLTWVEQAVRPWLKGRIHAVTENVLVRWKHITRERDARQQRAPATDLLIASIAIEQGLAIATRDTAPFVACGIPTLNPWTGERFNGA